MKYVHGKWICPKCGSSRIAAVSKALQCEICSGGMRRQSARRQVGEVLRRCTEDAASSMGRQVPARASFEGPLVADVRRLQLVRGVELAAPTVPRGRWKQNVGHSMEHALKNWNCTYCGRDNRTVVALDGTVQCARCSERMSIQPSRDYLSGFSTLHPELAPVAADRATPSRERPAPFGLDSLPAVRVR